MSSAADASHQPRPHRKNAQFWRATGYLRPHAGTIAISIVCAMLVAAAFTGGLTTMLPIMQVLIRGDSIQGWVNRKIVETRLDVQLADRSDKVRIQKIEADGAAARAELKEDDELKLPDTAEDTAAVSDAQRVAEADRLLEALSRPDVTQTQIRAGERTVQLSMTPLPWYLETGRSLAGQLPGRANPVWAIGAVFGILTLLALVSNVFRFFQEYLSEKAAILTVNDIRKRLYDHVLHIPLGFFGSKGTSDVTSRLAQDTANLQDGFKHLLGPSVQEPIRVVMAVSLALLVSWKLVLFILIFAPMMALLMKRFGKKMRRASRKAMQSSATMLGQLEGTLIGIRVVKAYNAERFERRRYGRIMDGLIAQSLKMGRIDAMSAPILESLTLIVAGAVVLYAAKLVLEEGSLRPTDFIMVMVCLASIGESLRRCSKINNAFQKANAAAGRIFETMDVPVERPRELGRVGSRQLAVGSNGTGNRPRVKLGAIQREVAFENVGFSYPNASSRALDGVSLTVPKGQSVAVVGRNGSGKTTLLALLARFYEPQEGRICIDGQDITQVTLKSLRGQISIVTQDSVIFPGTIEQNIAYGIEIPHDPAARQDLRRRVIEAAQSAFAHEFILEKPEGYDTMLGELGGQLSGGQKQRLCIARAIFRNSPILILDEATSQVDAESEELIQRAIEGVMRGRTTFVIAHRFHTIKSADLIVVMERGRIVGQGHHDDLLQTCSTYQQLYERQLVATPTPTDAASASAAAVSA